MQSERHSGQQLLWPGRQRGLHVQCWLSRPQPEQERNIVPGMPGGLDIELLWGNDVQNVWRQAVFALSCLHRVFGMPQCCTTQRDGHVGLCQRHARRDDLDNYYACPDDVHNYDACPDDVHNYDARRDDLDNHDARRDDLDNYDARRNDLDNYDARSDQRDQRDQRDRPFQRDQRDQRYQHDRPVQRDQRDQRYQHDSPVQHDNARAEQDRDAGAVPHDHDARSDAHTHRSIEYYQPQIRTNHDHTGI